MSISVPHKNHRQRMRERFKKNGLPAFKPHEILEMLLFAVYSRVNTNEIAHRLLDRFGSIAGVFAARESELREIHGVGEKATEYIRFLGQVYSEVTSERFSQFRLVSEDAIGMYAILRVGYSLGESASVTFLDGDGKIIYEEWLCIDKSKNEDGIEYGLAEKGRACGAKSIILMHNHRGVPVSPSPDDTAITAELEAEAKAVGIGKVWHVIVSDNEYTFI